MRFTLFTPVFNRANSIDRVWNSMLKQTCQDFEWICVDDGSSDESYDRLLAYREQAAFPMSVVRNESNQGKHVAWNRAVEIARGELFVPCDSDDEFDHDALDFFWQQWSGLTGSERNGASGINVLCRNAATGEVTGDLFPRSPMWSNNLELAYRLGVTGEKWGCIRTDILKAHRFPTTKGYFPEGYLWYAIAREYRVLCINKVLRTYYSDQANRISVPQVARMRAAYDYTAWHLVTNWDYIREQHRAALLEGSNLYLFGFFMKQSVAEINSRIEGAKVTRIWPMLALLGWVRYQRLKKQLKAATPKLPSNPVVTEVFE